MLGKQYYQNPMANKVVRMGRANTKLSLNRTRFEKIKLPSLTNLSTNLTTSNPTGKVETNKFSRGEGFSSTNFNSLMSHDVRSSVSLSEDENK